MSPFRTANLGHGMVVFVTSIHRIRTVLQKSSGDPDAILSNGVEERGGIVRLQNEQ